MTYLPAPYESARQDDLPAALAAGLTVTVAGISSWILGRWSYDHGRALIDQIRANQGTTLPKYVLIPTVGWGAAVLLMVIGSVLLAFRLGRGVLVLGAMIAIATTAVAQFSYHYGSSVAIPQWSLYWGAVVVFAVAVLPATGRWVTAVGAAKPAFPPSATYLPT
ncbi:hypothetical protein SAMN04515671_0489 [Nakamurella panacisegetis]|uniref:Uncharacterized protein n=1 Tax=Nakamurella panacisegetis TaxID=1090615 RepID=A0A1H0IFU3_9ACTN|nr:hypothetical protein [Nakamurella panacisegetis]SDO30278.1 hypothetical protein SAMN04515671_0489 [Nakamurella panacisegetis]